MADGLEKPRAGVIKVVLGLAVVAAESLPRGGVVSVSATPDAVLIGAEGTDASISEKALQALAGALEPENEVLVIPASVGMTARRFEVGYTVTSTTPPEFSVPLA
jgi:histidine phosphotransferase ChpT